MAERILIVEDEQTLKESLCRVFEREGYEVAAVASAEAALELFEHSTFDLVLTDIILPGISGIELVRRIREAAPDQAAVVMTAYASLETAVETLRAGAYDYIVKPIIHEEIKQTVRNALRLRTLQLENDMLKKEASEQFSIGNLVGKHPDIVGIRDRFKKLSDSLSPVLLYGEIGTGKRLIAKAIHASTRKPRFPFIEFHCSHYGPDEQDRLLFEPKGILSKVRNGTLYLNRIEALGESSQRKLFSIMEDRQLRFRESDLAYKFDALVISSTETEPESLIKHNVILEGLYERISVVKLRLPPLRERKEDIGALCDFFIAKYRMEFSKAVNAIAKDAVDLLKAYHWPGNVLELRNLLERAVLMTNRMTLTSNDFPLLSRSC